MSGKAVDIKSAALENFGKSFLLPLGVILGCFLLLTRDREYLTR